MRACTSFRLMLFAILLAGNCLHAQEVSVLVKEEPAAITVSTTATEPQQESSGLASTAAEAPKAELQTIAGMEAALPAGVCPVITDYLYELCQQTPGDPACQPAN